MSYLVSVSFDIKDGKAEDYATVYAALEKVGLTRTPTSEGGQKITLPTTMVLGEFEANHSVFARLDIAAKCRKAFRDNKLKGEIFVAVGKDWAWLRRVILDDAPRGRQSAQGNPCAARTR